MDSCIPPGFRFHPTDEELVGYYLKKKVASQKIDLDVIRDVDLYRIEPWDLQERCRIGYEEQTEWYFFSHKDKKYPTGTRTNRATMAGFWKATGRDKAVHDKSKIIGMRKTLVFYKGRAPNGHKTDWIMHEYRLQSDHDMNGSSQEEGWVVCRAFKKRGNSQTGSIVDRWDSTYSSGRSILTTISDPIHEYLHQQHSLCLGERQPEGPLGLLQHPNNFIQQLPQLESPSLPLPKPSSSLSIASDHNEDEEHPAERVRDWRALDRFVASQLSQEDGEFAAERGSDMALLLLQNEDVGICIFEK